MIWHRKERITLGRLGPIADIPMPPKKAFSTMLELLKDAEKYDCEGEPEISISILLKLKDCIDSHCVKKPPERVTIQPEPRYERGGELGDRSSYTGTPNKRRS